MALSVQSLRLSQFRNYEEYGLDDIGPLTVFIGRNGVGKTNILESLFLVASGGSFRNAHTVQFIRQGCEEASVAVEVGDESRHLDMRLLLEPGKKRYTVNGKAKHIADVKGTLPAVAFTPDDLELSKKSSSVKRHALDNLGTQLSKSYHVVARDFEKTVRYKNRLLKDEAPVDLIRAINDTLLVCATQLFCFRQALFNRMVPLASSYYSLISSEGELFDAQLIPSWEDDPENVETYGSKHAREKTAYEKSDVNRLLSESLESRLREEMARKRCVVGPQGDAITFTLDGRDVAYFASQGQQRSIVLAWKLAEVEMVRQTLGTAPILLLDDVMSELDERRRSMLVDFVTEDVQTFITATDLSSFDGRLLDRARVEEIQGDRD